MAARAHRPQLTNAARPATFEVEAYNERGEMVPTSVAGEHPLTLYLDKREDVDRYSEVMERLSVESEPPERTADILREILQDLE